MVKNLIGLLLLFFTISANSQLITISTYLSNPTNGQIQNVILDFHTDSGFEAHYCDMINSEFRTKATNFYYTDSKFYNLQSSGSMLIEGERYKYVYDLEYKNCILSEAGLFKFPINDIFYFTYADYLGRIYFSGIDDLNQFDGLNYDIGRIQSFANSKYENLNKTERIHYDLTIVNNEVFPLRVSTNVVNVLDTTFNFKRTIYLDARIASFATVAYSCDSIVTYGIGTQERFLKDTIYPASDFADDTLFVYTVDLKTGKCTKFTEHYFYISNSNISSGVFASSRSEFFASDPNCDLLVDLDFDNSGGLFPYDFCYSEKVCGGSNVLISDDDVYVHSMAPIDSLTFTISNFKDFGGEGLEYSGTNFELLKRSDSSYVLLPVTADLSDVAYQLAIHQISYFNYTSIPGPGIRTVTLIAHNRIKSSEAAKFFVDVQGYPYAGRDTVIYYCNHLEISDMASVMGEKLGGGQWLPTTTFYNSFNNFIDVDSIYKYVMTNKCGSDTASLKLVGGRLGKILPPDTLICDSDSLFVNLSLPVQGKVTWEDGTNGLLKYLLPTGMHTVHFLSEDGCEETDTIYVNERIITFPDFVDFITCNTDTLMFNGLVYPVRPRLWIQFENPDGCDTLKALNIIVKGVLEKSREVFVCEGGSFLDEIGNAHESGSSFETLRMAVGRACDTLVRTNVVAIPDPDPQIGGDTIICFGSSTRLHATEHNSYRWNTGSETRDIIVSGGSFAVTVWDTLDCQATATIIVVERPEWQLQMLETLEVEEGKFYDLILDGDSARISSVDVSPENFTLNKTYSQIPWNALREGEYVLTFKDEIGCFVKKELLIRFKNVSDRILPNVMKLGSSDNNYWESPIQENQTFESLQIFDRWGNKIFVSTSEPKWNGTSNLRSVIQGVYVYILEFKDEKGILSRQVGEILLLE